MKPVIVVEFRAGDGSDLPTLFHRVEDFLRFTANYPHTHLNLPCRIVGAREEPSDGPQRPLE